MVFVGTFGGASARGFGNRGAIPKYTTASGGTETTDGDYKIHTFNSSSN